jgi:GNAT superfamily N-acetyltransferase/chorismate mutase
VTPTDELDLSLRRAEPDDAAAIAELYTRARLAAVPMMPPGIHTAAEDLAWLSAQLARPTHEMWLAERAGALLGYAMIDPVWLEHLFVHADHTGEGIGTVLLDLVKSLRPDGFSLWVFESNTGARRFYARHGLVELERTNGAANEERAPDIRMAWPGADPPAFYRRLTDEVDEQLAGLLARRVALTRVVRALRDGAEDPSGDGSGADERRVREVAEAMAEHAPELGVERLARIVRTVAEESLDAARGPRDAP